MTRRSRSSSRRERPVVPWAAAAFAVGCGLPPMCGTWTLGGDLGTYAFAGAAVSAVGGLVLFGIRSAVAGRGATMVALVLLGSGAVIGAGRWSLVTPADRSAVRAGVVLIPAETGTGSRCDLGVPDEGLPTRLFARVATPPRPPPPGSDWLAHELEHGEGVRFEVEDASIDSGDGKPRRVRGRIRVALASAVNGLGVGDRIEGRGWMFAARTSRNPHPAPRSYDAWPSGGREGSTTATVTLGVDGLRVIGRESNAISTLLRNGRQGLRDRVERLVEAAATRAASGAPDPRPGLALTMLFGRGVRDDPETRDHFARSGLSHLVAISGFNFAVLGLGAAVVMRSVGGPWRLTAVAAAGLAGAYLVVVDDEPSVVRAGFVAVAGAMAEACGRRYRAGSLLGAVAISLLAADPIAITDPGFQLTFGAVLALRWAATPLGQRWYGHDDDAPSTLGDASIGAIRGLIVSSIAVWLVVTPISIVHFGQFSWLGLPLSIIAIPLGGLTIANGLAVAAVAAVDERLAGPLSDAWVWLTGVVLWIAETPARWQVPDIEIGRVGWAWAMIVAVAAVAWCRSRLWPVRRLAASVMAVGWTAVGWEAIQSGRDEAVEWIMLDVGDGSCHILRHGSDAVVFDAGSLDLRSLGIRTATPALRAAGVRRLEAVIVSHPNIDHFAAVPAILAGFPTERLIVNPMMQEAAMRDPGGASGKLLAAARSLRVPVEIGAAGRRERLAGGTWTWLHPPPDARYAGDNDGSQVIHVQWPIDGRTVDAVLAGDLETAGVRDLLDGESPLHPHLVELPHHGSWRPAVAAWIESMDPAAVYQSTGSERWRRDRWNDALSGSLRRVTCIDGAVRAKIESRGGGPAGPVVTFARWDSSGWRPCGMVSIDRPTDRELSDSAASPAAVESRRRSGRVRPRSPRSRDPARRAESGSRSDRSRRRTRDGIPRSSRPGPRGRTTSRRRPGRAASPRRPGSTTPWEASTGPYPRRAGRRRRRPPGRAFARSRTQAASTRARFRSQASVMPRSRRAEPPSRHSVRRPANPRAGRGSARARSPPIVTRAAAPE